MVLEMDEASSAPGNATLRQHRLAEAGRAAVRRLTRGDIGSLPILLGLVVIAAIFQIANRHFLSPLNLTNLLVQISAVGTISVGVVLVLLIGEIDLSVGAVSGVTAGVMAVLSAKMLWPGPAAVAVGILAGLAIGLFQGSWFAKIHVPSFVVTLAGYLGWQGALLYVLGSTGTINLNDPVIVGLANTRTPVNVGWAIAVLIVIVYAWSLLSERARRTGLGLEATPVASAVGRIAIVAVAVLAAVALMNVNRNPDRTGPAIRGVPTAIVILLAFIVIFDLILRRTRFGRAVFAVGGNVEAARRAGINVDRLRIVIFGLSSGLAACGGILAGSRLLAVNQSSGSGDVLLNAIAAAVIGGTSLFGGRGSTWSALLGALVIGAIANGMDLLAFASSVKFMVTGVVLLLAVTVDAFGHARREQSGT
jgi:D-xylose transport system permease protein